MSKVLPQLLFFCSGSDVVFFLQRCPRFQPWSLWSSCSVSCGRGVITRARTCIDGTVGNVGCIGDTEEEGECIEGVRALTTCHVIFWLFRNN